MTESTREIRELIPGAFSLKSRREMLRGSGLAALGALLTLALPFPLLAANADFAAWLADFRAEAAAAGVSQKTLDRTLNGLEPLDRVIELDRKQPEFTQTFWGYMEPRINDTRIAGGQVKLSENAKVLSKVEGDYGVSAEMLMAFWGLETNYGGYMGDFPVIQSLATLAWDERRSAFFRIELLNALKIVDAGHIWPEAMVGSWAGAMGYFQFLPSTFLNNAVDYDGDQRADIWNNTTDAFASAANFLRNSGWTPGQPWGFEVTVPADFPWELSGADDGRQPVSRWQALGVRLAEGGADLPYQPVKSALLLPAGWQGPAFVVLPNFFTTLRWNNSHLYAISVGHLGDRIAGKGGFKAQRPAKEERMSREAIKEMQQLLNKIGYDSGDPDGKVGPMTRGALKKYQLATGFPADAYPTPAILASLRQAAG